MCGYVFHYYCFTFHPFHFLDQPLEKEKVKKAADHCRQMLNFVNQAVKEAENKQVRRGRCNSVFKS